MLDTNYNGIAQVTQNSGASRIFSNLSEKLVRDYFLQILLTESLLKADAISALPLALTTVVIIGLDFIAKGTF